MTNDFGKHGRSPEPSCIKRRMEVRPGITSTGYFSEAVQLVGQGYFFDTSEHRRLDIEHRPGNLGEAVAWTVIGVHFVSS